METLNKFLVEYTEYIAADSKRYPLFNGRRTNMSYRGAGVPDINFITDKGPFQHGESVRDWRYNSRNIGFELYEGGLNRRDYYRHEANMIDAMRPNRAAGSATSGTVRVWLDDGSQREIDAWLGNGPAGDWDGQGSLNPADMMEEVRFYCPDPFWRDVDSTTVTFTVAVFDACLDDICLPFCLGSNLIQASQDITYEGTWFGDQITITLTGPMISPIISNNTTGKSIGLNYTIANGESVTVTILPTAQTVVSNLYGNLIGTVTSVSDLVDFQLIPPSDLAPLGVNEIEVFASGGVDGVSGISINYYTRYITLYGSGD